jgi:hypothetical protein
MQVCSWGDGLRNWNANFDGRSLSRQSMSRGISTLTLIFAIAACISGDGNSIVYENWYTKNQAGHASGVRWRLKEAM